MECRICFREELSHLLNKLECFEIDNNIPQPVSTTVHQILLGLTASKSFFLGSDRLRPISTSASSFFRVRPIRLRPISTSANFDFGQFDFGQFDLSQFLDVEFWDDKVWGQKGGGPKGGAPKGGAPNGGGPKFRAFFPSSATIFFLHSLSCGPYVEFCWCLKRRGPEMCTFGVLGLSCASPGGPVWWGRRGFTRQPENSKCAHFRVPANKKTNKIQRKDPRERKKNENCGGRREKKSEILGGPAEGCPVEGCPAEGGSPEGGGPAEGSIGNGVQVLGFGFSSGFWGRKQKQHKNKMKIEMSKSKKKVKKCKKTKSKKKTKDRKKKQSCVGSTWSRFVVIPRKISAISCE